MEKIFKLLFPSLALNFSSLIEWSIFFGIIVLYIVGIQKYQKLYTTWETDIKNIKSWRNCGSLADLIGLTQPTALRWVESLPGVFMVLGLLGTFLGLAFGIDGAYEALSIKSGNTNEISEALKGALKNIGAQFKTSIWGIIANLVFRFQVGRLKQDGKVLEAAQKVIDNTITKVQDEKNEAFRVLISSGHSSIKQQLDDNKKKLLSKFDENLDKLDEIITNENINHDALVDAINNGVNKISQEILESRTVLNNANDNLRLVKENIGKLESAANNLKSVAENFAGSLKTTTEQYTKVSQDFGEKVNEFGGVVNTFGTNVKQVMEDANKTFNGISEKLDGKLNEINTGLNAAISNFQNETKTAISGMSEQMKGATSSLSETVGSLSIEVTKTLNASNIVFEKMSQDLSEKLNQIKKGLEGAINGFEKTTGHAIDNMSEGLKSSTDELGKIVGDLSSGIVLKIGELGSYMNNLSSSMEKIENILAYLDATVEGFQGSMVKQEARIGDLIESQKTMEGMRTRLTAAIGNLDMVKKIEQNIQKVSEDINKRNNGKYSVADTISDIQRIKEILETLKPQNEKRLDFDEKVNSSNKPIPNKHRRDKK